MIFRNPYGYLIKHFRLIHLFLTALYIYLAIKVNSVLQYYNHFISGSVGKINAISYIDYYYLIAIVMSIIICIVIYFLMRYKQKPRFLYLYLIGFYFIVFVIIQIAYSGLNTIYFSYLEVQTVRLYRDILRIMIAFQYLSIFFVLIRGLGFDIKKFNFVKDLVELGLNEEDTEEIELSLSSNRSILRRIRRRIRELKYYYVENKLFILISLFIIILLFSFGMFYRFRVVLKVYKEGEVVSTDQFQFHVMNTYITDRDSHNTVISSDDYSFVILRIAFSANRDKDILNVANLILKCNGHSYSSNSRLAARFTDLGIAYRDYAISSSGNVYLFIFYVDKNDLTKDMRLEYASDEVIQLNPVRLDEVTSSYTYRVGEKIDWSSTNLTNGYFEIGSYEIADKINYTYQYEAMGRTNSANLTIHSDNGIILHLDVDYRIVFSDSLFDFLEEYGSLKYRIGEEEFVSNVFSDRTPNSYKDGLYLVVDREVEKADSVWFEFVIRNYKYVYVLK